MNQKPKLAVDFCSYQAAKYAVEHWHYSKSMPTPPVVKIGVWEDKQFIGVVLFSRGATNNLSKYVGLEMTSVCELTRVALDNHRSYVSQIVKKAIKLLRQMSPELKVIFSYADPNEGHTGAIYQAMNWIYTGTTPNSYKYRDRSGRVWHGRQVSRTGVKRQYGETRAVPKIGDCEKIPQLGKHRYLMALTRKMRKQIDSLAKPYPKRAGG